MASGVKFESVWCADKWYDELQSLQARFESQCGELMPTFEQRGYAGEDEIEGQLKITEAGYQVFFPKYGVLANLVIDPARPAPNASSGRHAQAVRRFPLRRRQRTRNRPPDRSASPNLSNRKRSRPFRFGRTARSCQTTRRTRSKFRKPALMAPRR